jgi:hypothetical protein
MLLCTGTISAVLFDATLQGELDLARTELQMRKAKLERRTGLLHRCGSDRFQV